MALLDLILTDLGGSSFWCWTQRLGCLTWDSILPLFEGKFCVFGIHPNCASLAVQVVNNPSAMQTRPWFDSWVGKIPWKRIRLPVPVFLGFPSGSNGKESSLNAEDLGLIPGLGRSLGGGYGNLLQSSCLENPHGHRSRVGYGPWSHKESDMTEQLSTVQLYYISYLISFQ